MTVLPSPALVGEGVDLENYQRLGELIHANPHYHPCRRRSNIAGP